jgi:hypothetical protein
MSNTLLQKITAGFGNSSSARTLQYSGNVTAGSLLSCWVATAAGTAGHNGITVSVSDNINGAWTQAGGYVRDAATNQNSGSWWYFANSAGGSKPVVTVTPSDSVYTGIGLHEHSVTSATGVAVDSTSTNTGNSANPATGVCHVSSAGELVLAGYGQGSTALSTCSVGSPFTLENSQLNGVTDEGLGTADDVNASASEGATFTLNTSVGWAAMAISFFTATTFPTPLLRRKRRARAFRIPWEHYQMKFRPFPVTVPTPLPVCRRQVVMRQVATLRRNAGQALFAQNVQTTVLVTSPRRVR